MVGADRDPQGDQVSIVYRVKVNTAGARGEADKTQIEWLKNSAATLPIAHAFAFSDHHTTVAAMMAA